MREDDIKLVLWVMLSFPNVQFPNVQFHKATIYLMCSFPYLQFHKVLVSQIYSFPNVQFTKCTVSLKISLALVNFSTLKNRFPHRNLDFSKSRLFKMLLDLNLFQFKVKLQKNWTPYSPCMVGSPCKTPAVVFFLYSFCKVLHRKVHACKILTVKS